jgi:hypothetical protein
LGHQLVVDINVGPPHVVNPLESVNQFLKNVLVNNRTPAQMESFFTAPIVFAVLVYGLLFLYASPALRLEAGKTNRVWAYVRHRVGSAVIAGLIMVSLSTP